MQGIDIDSLRDKQYIINEYTYETILENVNGALLIYKNENRNNDRNKIFYVVPYRNELYFQLNYNSENGTIHFYNDDFRVDQFDDFNYFKYAIPLRPHEPINNPTDFYELLDDVIPIDYSLRGGKNRRKSRKHHRRKHRRTRRHSLFSIIDNNYLNKGMGFGVAECRGNRRFP
jgi:hypothetical protein